MSEIILTTINVKYYHSSLGLRYLRSNLRELEEHSKILEFTASLRPSDIAEKILAEDPRIVGIGVYIWNVDLSLKVISIIKKVRPEIIIVIGGPEVSHQYEDSEIFKLSDFLIIGEADLAFYQLSKKLLDGDGLVSKVIFEEKPDLNLLSQPYRLYSDSDLIEKLVSVEVSRGCPFHCQFCLSSIEKKVRQFNLDLFLLEMQSLLDRGARRFKFIDRTFNLDIDTGFKVLSFFRERICDGLFLHFEMVPDRFPEKLRNIISEFPETVIQFEIGIQTFNKSVATRIGRQQNYDLLMDNFLFLKQKTKVHLHADLIVGLPGETLNSFANGFDKLLILAPDDIQVGILKRLKGAKIKIHDNCYGMVYSDIPPYEILKNNTIDFMTMQRLKRFARYFDLVFNSNNFEQSSKLIWGNESPFFKFLEFSDWLYQRCNRTHAISLKRLAGFLKEFLVTEKELDGETVLQMIQDDYMRVPGRKISDCRYF